MKPMKRSNHNSIVATGALVLVVLATPAWAQTPPSDAPAVDPTPPPAERKPTRRGIAIPGTWLAQGPAPTKFGQVENIVPDNEVTGAIHTVVAHPTDPDLLYLGGVNSGVWRTRNATAVFPDWEPLTDEFASLSIGAMEFDPTDKSSRTLIVGIGRFSSFGFAGGRLNGLLYTTDGGDSWIQIEDLLFDGANISGVAARGNVLVVAENFVFGSGGLYRSTDVGASWDVVDGNGTGLPNGSVHDLVGDPSDPNVLYCSVRGEGIYRSDDIGASWARISDTDAALQAVMDNGANNNAEMAVATDGRLYVNALLSGQSAYIGYTDSPAAATPTWVAMDLPFTPQGEPVPITDASNTAPIVITSPSHGVGRETVVIDGVLGNTAANGVFEASPIDSDRFELEGSAGNGDYAGGGGWNTVSGLNPRVKAGSQGTRHSSILADGTTLYVGGDRQDVPFPNFIGAQNFTGRLFRGDTTVAPTGGVPSPQWEHLTHRNDVAAIPEGGTISNSAPHADSREMVFDANGDLIEVSDGGIYRRTSPADNQGDWLSINGDLQATEMHSVAYDTRANILIGGSQDNGTEQQRSTGNLEWAQVLGGDGGDVVVDDFSTPGVSIRYTSAQFLLAFFRHEYDENNVRLSTTFPALEVLEGSDFEGQFVTPLELNIIDGNRLLIHGSNSLYETLDRGETLREVGPGISGAFGQFALVAGGRLDGVDNADVAFVGSGSEIYRRTSAGSFFSDLDFPGGFVRDIVADGNRWMTAWALTPDSVFSTLNGGDSWAEITGDLPDTDLRAMAFARGLATDHLFVSGRDGVFVMDVASPGVWSELGTNLPNAPAYDLDYDSADDLLVVSTMGRGSFIMPFASCLVSGDTDLDGRGDSCDCAPGDAGVFDLANVTLQVTDPTRLDWDDPAIGSGTATTHNVLRGGLGGFPVGNGVDETCLAIGVSGNTFDDPAVPASGTGFWYLVQTSNSCGLGPLGEGTNRGPVACVQ